MAEIKALDLFDAYNKSKLPKENGYIVSSFFHESIAYARYEIVSYANVKSIYPSDEGLTFQTDGKKLYVLIEPPSYANKGMEPYVRSMAEQIPLRFNELDLDTCKNQMRIYIGKKPVNSFGSFTIMKPTGINFTFVFYPLPDMHDTMALFFEKTLNKESQIPLADAKRAARNVVEKIRTVMKVDFT